GLERPGECFKAWGVDADDSGRLNRTGERPGLYCLAGSQHLKALNRSVIVRRHLDAICGRSVYFDVADCHGPHNSKIVLVMLRLLNAIQFDADEVVQVATVSSRQFQRDSRCGHLSFPLTERRILNVSRSLQQSLTKKPFRFAKDFACWGGVLSSF